MKKLIFIVAAVCAATIASGAYQQKPGMKTVWGEKITPENAWREYPRPQMVRDAWTNLNGLWQYAVTKDAPGMPKNWDGEILVPFAIESSLSGVKRELQPNELLWYRRSINANVKPGERLILHIEQADFRTQVFVNRVEVGVPHEGGQVPFSFDITDYVKSGENELIVCVWDPTSDFIGSIGKQAFKPAGIFYTRTSGICGTVWLETVPETHVTDYKVVTDIDAGTVAVTLDGVGNLTEVDAKVDVLKDGKKVASGELKKWGKPIVIKLPQPIALWSPESPALYDLQITFKDDETDVKDIVKGYFGMRKIELKEDKHGTLRFFFNNKPRFILGTLDQGWWPDGLLTPPSDEAMTFDILELKKMGYDTMRKHIKVEPRRYYWLCDKLGIIVVQDMPSGRHNGGTGFANQAYGFYRREWKAIMDLLQKTPSIVMWVPYNENWAQPDQNLTHMTLMWTQRYDPTRLVDGPSGWNDYEGGTIYTGGWGTTKHPGPGEEEAAHAIDRHDYTTYPNMYPLNDRRASFLGEFGGIGCRLEDHLWTANAWGYGGTGNITDRKAVQKRFITLMEHVATLAKKGLAGSIYTQTTDVEGEINGLISYDRKLVKFDSAALAAVHAKVRAMADEGSPRIRMTEKVLFSKYAKDPKTWAYTFEAPAADWAKPTFNDAAWKRSAGGFGNEEIKGVTSKAKVTTMWTTPNLWVRRHFTYDGAPGKILNVVLELFHDEDAEIYLNGEKLYQATGYVSGFCRFNASVETFNKLIKKGDNVLAVKISQKMGGQYFDMGLSLECERKK